MIQDAISLGQLYLISINLAEKNATNIISYNIEKLLTNETIVGHVRSCVDTCAEVYSPVISLLQDAHNAFKSKNYATAKASLSSAITIPDSCEQFFAEGEIATESLLAKEDATFHQMAAISLAFLSMMQG
ncbi:hypothetical protein SLEP1_g22063 [Rubroshorea leprosula]|uniref:Pectinesterase inhibitor domain-containing protein n=1 Tax=Rubroshorea leprosula TaxID=152421 RepID=A0AAV5JGU8_9ROSI|nr:hypothetical protein SLEP1_g22063 [Rubroshorea leprosula]